MKEKKKKKKKRKKSIKIITNKIQVNLDGTK